MVCVSHSIVTGVVNELRFYQPITMPPALRVIAKSNISGHRRGLLEVHVASEDTISRLTLCNYPGLQEVTPRSVVDTILAPSWS
jgi:acyl-CoA hydrolase